MIVGGNAGGNTFSVAVGAGANAQNYCTAIGNSSQSGTSNGCVMLGHASGNGTATNGSIILGSGAYVSGGNAVIAIGSSATSYSSAGSGAFGSANFAIAIGCGTGSFKTQAAANGIAIGGSESASVTAATGSVAIGQNTQATGQYTFATGYSTTAAYQGSIAMGPRAATDFVGEFAFTAGVWSILSDAKMSLTVLRRDTADATPVEMVAQAADAGAANGANRIALTNNSLYMYDCDVIARKSTTGTDYSAWNLKFAINREANAASTALVGTVTKTLVGQTAGASGWDVNVTADTTNGRPNISVTGQASTNIRWVAGIKIVKCQG